MSMLLGSPAFNMQWYPDCTNRVPTLQTMKGKWGGGDQEVCIGYNNLMTYTLQYNRPHMCGNAIVVLKF